VTKKRDGLFFIGSFKPINLKAISKIKNVTFSKSLKPDSSMRKITTSFIVAILVANEFPSKKLWSCCLNVPHVTKR